MTHMIIQVCNWRDAYKEKKTLELYKKLKLAHFKADLPKLTMFFNSSLDR